MVELTGTDSGVQFRLKVVPGASRSRVVGEMDGALKVAVAAPPEKGRANKAVIALLARALGVKNAAVRIESGTTSQHKRCHVTGLSPDQVQRILQSIT